MSERVQIPENQNEVEHQDTPQCQVERNCFPIYDPFVHGLKTGNRDANLGLADFYARSRGEADSIGNYFTVNGAATLHTGKSA